jgi:hypothetical protein
VLHRVALTVLAAVGLVGLLGCGSGGRQQTPSTGKIVVSVSNGPPMVLASLRTFVGYWWGHTRGLDIHRSGLGSERVATHSPRLPVYGIVRFRVTGITGTQAAAAARIRVTSVQTAGDGTFAGIRAGRRGELRLGHGVVTDTITHVSYCAPKVDRCGL